jgi:hypothetical protein
MMAMNGFEFGSAEFDAYLQYLRTLPQDELNAYFRSDEFQAFDVLFQIRVGVAFGCEIPYHNNRHDVPVISPETEV